MYIAPGEPDPDGPSHEGFADWDFDPAKVFARFGAPFGMLIAPHPQRRHVGQFFCDSSPTGTPVPTLAPVLPVTLTIRHDLRSGNTVDVATRLTYGHPLDLLDHMWGSVIDRRLAHPPEVGMPDLQAWASAIALRPRPATSADVELELDDARTPASAMVDDDLLVCGCQTGDALIAVVVPLSIAERAAPHPLSLAMWRPPTSDARAISEEVDRLRAAGPVRLRDHDASRRCWCREHGS